MSVNMRVSSQLSKLTPEETRASVSAASILATRLLGLFMIYPVFASYARGLRGSTPELIGLSLGAYGLTQGLLQIPFGMLSDRFGRKIIIVLGLVLFGIGSVVAARATTIDGVLLGRILQGTGAIGSVLLALVADATRREVRTRAMAIVGSTIGLSFMVAVGLGPAVAGVIGVPGIFWLTALSAVAGIGIALSTIPTIHKKPLQKVAVGTAIPKVLKNIALLRLDYSIFTLHAILTASFLAVPFMLLHTMGVHPMSAWELYVPVLAVSVIFMIPIIILAEKKGLMKQTLIGAIFMLTVSTLALALAGTSSTVLVIALVIFFTAFITMESLLPSLVTKIAPSDIRGTATGVYSSAQFLGIFFGGALGGIALAVGSTNTVLWFAFAMSLFWFFFFASDSYEEIFSIPTR